MYYEISDMYIKQNNINKGFTLIELLVVIAIIGSLSAMLVPNFMAARERARDSVRKSDLSQIQKALELYKQDVSPPSFPGTLPPPGTQWKSPPPVENVYMQKVPKDPLSSSITTIPYYYEINATDRLKYTLAACVENKGELDLVNCPMECTSGKCYILNEP